MLQFYNNETIHNIDGLSSKILTFLSYSLTFILNTFVLEHNLFLDLRLVVAVTMFLKFPQSIHLVAASALVMFSKPQVRPLNGVQITEVRKVRV